MRRVLIALTISVGLAFWFEATWAIAYIVTPLGYGNTGKRITHTVMALSLGLLFAGLLVYVIFSSNSTLGTLLGVLA